MKKILLLLSSVTIFGSINAQDAITQSLQTENTQSNETAIIAEKQLLVPFSIQKKAVTPEEVAVIHVVAPVKKVETMAVASPVIAVTNPTSEVAKNTKTRVKLRDIVKVRKALKANSTAPVRDGADILAILGVIFGVAGAVVMFTSGLVGILLGIAGLGFGVIALQRVTGLKMLSTIGIILGAVVTVVATVLLLT